MPPPTLRVTLDQVAPAELERRLRARAYEAAETDP